ncbi:unnamed protein product [Kuraishia capsulata CBS 1993]|uniref:Transcription initiation factor TFIID subunit 8 n=1 Tax=Kuraishia capsulata CBS 1993 TaxID=1382522 RepID=W6MGJ1_9ASCO|nr:uncharacterized protein KUCA_T00000898001 [Kuraishia capsulata CBS 1993]CDK24931.1 unnamed protein product [Kuraishia capsulata CBS 1993]
MAEENRDVHDVVVEPVDVFQPNSPEAKSAVVPLENTGQDKVGPDQSLPQPEKESQSESQKESQSESQNESSTGIPPSEEPQSETPVEQKTPVRELSKEEVLQIRQNWLEKNAKEISKISDWQVQLPLEQILGKAVGLLLASLDINCNRAALDHLALLAMEHTHTVIARLHRITEIQRRRRISAHDLKILIREGIISLEDIEDAYLESKKRNTPITKMLLAKLDTETRKIVDETNAFTAGDQTVDAEDPASCFFHDITDTIARVVPQKAVRKAYIPKYLPELPPVHTYKATPQYTKTVTDPRVLREKLVEEGRLGEKALQHIVGNDSATPEAEMEVDSDEEEKEEDEEKQDQSDQKREKEEENGKEKQNTETASSSDLQMDIEKRRESEVLPDGDDGAVKVHAEPQIENEGETQGEGQIQTETQNEKQNETQNETTEVVASTEEVVTDKEKGKEKEPDRVDLVNYAKKRLAILEKRTAKRNRALEERLARPETIVSKYMGSFSIQPLNESVSQIVSDIYATEFENALKSVKISEKRRAKHLREEAKKRQKIEEEKRKQQESIEFGFGEGDGHDQDDDLDFNFDFGNDDVGVHDQMENLQELEEVSIAEVAIGNKPVFSTSREVTPNASAEAGGTSQEEDFDEELYGAETPKAEAANTGEGSPMDVDGQDFGREQGQSVTPQHTEPTGETQATGRSLENDDESDEFDDSMFDEVL